MIETYPQLSTSIDDLGSENFTLGLSSYHRTGRRADLSRVKSVVDLDLIAKGHAVLEFNSMIEQNSDTLLSPLDGANLLE